jgi:serine phosphatase RsbU (regulator of sigma subunit)
VSCLKKTDQVQLDSPLSASEDVAFVQDNFVPKSGRKFYIYGNSILSHFQPASKAGGDWLFFFPLRKHNSVLFAVADVTGHGLGSAMLTGVLAGAASAFSATVNLECYPKGEILARFNLVLHQAMLNHGSRSNLFATAFTGLLERKEESVSLFYSGFAHPPAIVCTPSQEKVTEISSALLLRSDMSWLGEEDDEKIARLVGEYKSFYSQNPEALQPGYTKEISEEEFFPSNYIKQVNIESGQRILVFTDGLIEKAASGKTGLTAKSLISLVRESDSIGSAYAGIVSKFQSLHNGLLKDDSSFLIIQV